jgi:hypothetical protein
MKTCIFTKPDGTQCNAYAVKDDEFCFSHSEKYKDKHLEAVMSGGKSLKRSYADQDPIILRNNEDIVYLIEQVINDVRANNTSNKTASVIAMYINLAIKAISLALNDKAQKRNTQMFNTGNLDLKQHIEKLEGELRIKTNNSNQ